MKNLDYKSIGTRVRKQRELLGYTREELAELLDVSAKFCSDIELGIKGMSLNTLARLSEVLYLNTEYILFGSSSKTDETEALVSLIYSCPEKHRSNLITIIRAFIGSVSE